jgi:hypothetical protein
MTAVAATMSKLLLFSSVEVLVLAVCCCCKLDVAIANNRTVAIIGWQLLQQSVCHHKYPTTLEYIVADAVNVVT